MSIEVLGPLLSSGRAMQTCGWCIRHQKQLRGNQLSFLISAISTPFRPSLMWCFKLQLNMFLIFI